MTTLTTQNKSVGKGRVIFSNGVSVWIGQAREPTERHSHHAIQISLVLSDGHMRLDSEHQGKTEYRNAVITSNQQHSFEARGELVAQIFIEPESREGRMIIATLRPGVSTFPEACITELKRKLLSSYVDKCADDVLIALGREISQKIASLHDKPLTELDPRIQKAQGIIKSYLGGSISLELVAAQVFLSPDRFRHLFIEQTGIRFRPYVLWLRLCTAASHYAEGHTLTDSALVGGFADAAHFTRTFRRMFGTAPIRVTIDR
jgi:AraC-like DNA-binding protein